MTRAIRNAFAAALLVLATAVEAGPFGGLAIFGDSLGDTGNNAVFFDVFGSGLTPPVPPGTRTPTPIPNALTQGSVIPTFPYASDRYSNGTIWVEQLAVQIGLSAEASLLGGTNFAFGGARTGPVGTMFPPSLRDQVGTFLGQTGGIAPPDWLYIVIGGGNDARDALTGTPPMQIIDDYATNIGTILAQLTGAGADHILLANVPDIGKTPAVQLLDQTNPGAGIADATSALALAMNATLVGLVLPALPPEARDNLAVLDLFGLLNQIVLDPAIDTTLMCAADPACVGQPGNVFFWDGIHPTTFGHSLLAAAALRAIPEPATLALLAVALAALTVLRRPRRA